MERYTIEQVRAILQNEHLVEHISRYMRLSDAETISKAELQKLIQQHRATYDDLDRDLKSIDRLANTQLDVHVEEAAVIDQSAIRTEVQKQVDEQLLFQK